MPGLSALCEVLHGIQFVHQSLEEGAFIITPLLDEETEAQGSEGTAWCDKVSCQLATLFFGVCCGSPLRSSVPLSLLPAPTCPLCVTVKACAVSVCSVPGTALGASRVLTRLPFPIVSHAGH